MIRTGIEECRRAPTCPPGRLPTMTAAACGSMRPWTAKTTSPAAAVTPIVKVVVEAATLRGTPIRSLVTGVFRNPPPAPATPADHP